ncbi:hypothetical protein GGX14DRAFT_394817 [Mycena pura]|uniref:Uncharacterized protein n=1 Tax=Mycena pura TaxID=153505 RepID=A0AAD6VDU7_9AGAR|nr:hypothetical protein GGX14DRAFT_394817 [Mycena pura]
MTMVSPPLSVLVVRATCTPPPRLLNPEVAFLFLGSDQNELVGWPIIVEFSLWNIGRSNEKDGTGTRAVPLLMAEMGLSAVEWDSRVCLFDDPRPCREIRVTPADVFPVVPSASCHEVVVVLMGRDLWMLECLFEIEYKAMPVYVEILQCYGYNIAYTIENYLTSLFPNGLGQFLEHSRVSSKQPQPRDKRLMALLGIHPPGLRGSLGKAEDHQTGKPVSPTQLHSVPFYTVGKWDLAIKNGTQPSKVGLRESQSHYSRIYLNIGARQLSVAISMFEYLRLVSLRNEVKEDRSQFADNEETARSVRRGPSE